MKNILNKTIGLVVVLAMACVLVLPATMVSAACKVTMTLDTNSAKGYVVKYAGNEIKTSPQVTLDNLTGIDYSQFIVTKAGSDEPAVGYEVKYMVGDNSVWLNKSEDFPPEDLENKAEKTVIVKVEEYTVTFNWNDLASSFNIVGFLFGVMLEPSSGNAYSGKIADVATKIDNIGKPQLITGNGKFFDKWTASVDGKDGPYDFKKLSEEKNDITLHPYTPEPIMVYFKCNKDDGTLKIGDKEQSSPCKVKVEDIKDAWKANKDYVTFTPKDDTKKFKEWKVVNKSNEEKKLTGIKPGEIFDPQNDLESLAKDITLEPVLEDKVTPSDDNNKQDNDKQDNNKQDNNKQDNNKQDAASGGGGGGGDSSEPSSSSTGSNMLYSGLSNPKTGDVGITVWASLITISTLGAAGVVKFLKRVK